MAKGLILPVYRLIGMRAYCLSFLDSRYRSPNVLIGRFGRRCGALSANSVTNSFIHRRLKGFAIQLGQLLPCRDLDLFLYVWYYKDSSY